LDFEKVLIPYEGNSDWVESFILAVHECLSKDILPKAAIDCDY
jgi:hypothetical protein